MDTETQRKWDAASRSLDLFAWGDDHRLGPHKRRLLSKVHVSASGPCGSSTGLTACSGSCAFCHGTDGRTPPTLGRSFYPRAPDLSSAQVQAYSDAELFWIIKNGIRLSGMPGFGNIHSDEEIWDLVSYVRSLGAPSRR